MIESVERAGPQACEGRVGITGSEPGSCNGTGAGIPGTLSRGEVDWEMYFYDPEHWRDGATAFRFVVYEGEDGPSGYLLYRQKEDWEGSLPRSEVRIGDLQAVDGEAYRALWRYFFGMDLVLAVKARTRRLREPLALLLEDPRRLQELRCDNIWLRLLDVAGAGYLIFGGLFVLSLGLFVERRDMAFGWGLVVTGGVASAVGVVLVWVRSRMND